MRVKIHYLKKIEKKQKMNAMKLQHANVIPFVQIKIVAHKGTSRIRFERVKKVDNDRDKNMIVVRIFKKKFINKFLLFL